jgi:hypothetical protein
MPPTRQAVQRVGSAFAVGESVWLADSRRLAPAVDVSMTEWRLKDASASSTYYNTPSLGLDWVPGRAGLGVPRCRLAACY